MTDPFDRDELMNMTHAQIRAAYAETFGEQSRSPNRTWMVNRILAASPQEVAVPPSAVAVPATAITPEQPPPEPGLGATPQSTPSAPSLADRIYAASAVDGIAGAASFPPLGPQRLVDSPSPEVAASATAPCAVANEDGRPASEPMPSTQPRPDPPAPILSNATRGTCSTGTDGVTGLPLDPAKETGWNPCERGRYRGMTVEELHHAYAQIIQRPTSSTDRPYLIWKLTQADKGRVRVGPFEAREHPEGPLKPGNRTLPLILSAAAVLAVDEAWPRLGFKSRMAFVRTAIREALLRRREVTAASHFPTAPGA